MVSPEELDQTWFEFYLVLDPLEIQDPEVGELVDDEEPVVGLGHDGVVQQRQHRDRLHRRERLLSATVKIKHLKRWPGGNFGGS